MFRRVGCLTGLTACVPGLVAGAELMVNGLFEDALNGWTSQGAVSVTSGFALIQESGPGSSGAIFQSVAVGPDPLILTFELFVGGMSTEVPLGFLADTVFGTVYFGNAAFGNDASAGNFDEQLQLFDFDRDGFRNEAPGLSRVPVPGRPDWERFEIGFTTSRQFVTFVVESVDLNQSELPDSVVAVDEVSLVQTVIPEPSTVFLLIPTLLLLTRRARAP